MKTKSPTVSSDTIFEFSLDRKPDRIPRDVHSLSTRTKGTKTMATDEVLVTAVKALSEKCEGLTLHGSPSLGSGLVPLRDIKLCKDLVRGFLSNVADLNAWRRDYPDGMSVEDLCNSDTVNASHDHDDYVYADGLRICLIDGGPNFDTRYPI